MRPDWLACLGIAVVALGAACSRDGAPPSVSPPEETSTCKTTKERIPQDPRGVWVAPQKVTIGSSQFHPEEAPPRALNVNGFWIDPYEVTTGEFANFVAATGYKTVAEREAGGGGVFDSEWRLEPSATWRKPFGQEGSEANADDPVVQVAFEDALAYANWRGRDLPTEAEWEMAARGGIANAEYVWGNASRLEDGKPGANHWQGVFPYVDLGEDGFKRLAPVGCFPPNGYALYDMAGNVWEWTKDRWSLPQGADATAAAPVVTAAQSMPGARVIKGGSWLCADNFCHRYRPAARQPGDPSMGTNHIGFRTVLREN